MERNLSETIIAQTLVRRYSDELKNQPVDNQSREILQKALHGELEQERALTTVLEQGYEVSHGHASTKLKAQCSELQEAVNEFTSSLPDNVRPLQPSNNLTWDDLYKSIHTLKRQHNEKSTKGLMGQAKKRFHKLCETVESHSNMLKLLPQGDKYTSILCGSLEAITKASVSYIRIDEEFTNALEEINRIVGAIERELTVYRGSFIEDLAVQLACKVIAFMSCSVKWYSQRSRKRLLMSFNEQLLPKYQHYVDDIRSISSMIQRGTHFHVAKTVSALPKSIEEIREMVVYFMEVQKETSRRSDEQWDIFHKAQECWNTMLKEQSDMFFSNMSLQLGQHCSNGLGRPIKEILDREAIDSVQNELRFQSKDESLQCRTLIQSAGTNPETSALDKNPHHTKSDIEEASEVLNKYFSYDQCQCITSGEESFADIEAIQRLQSWTAMPKSAFLGVAGPSYWKHNSPTQLIASHYVQAAGTSGIPCISYFCQLSDDDPPEGRLRETVGSVAMLYGLMRQLIFYLPRQLSQSPVQIQRDRFDVLDGTLRTWKEALSLFDDLLRCIKPSSLLCTIHGIETLEHIATIESLILLMKLLRSHMGSGPTISPNVFKVLLTTSGVSQTVGMMLGEDEILDINRGSVTHSPGRAKKGRKSFQELSF